MSVITEEDYEVFIKECSLEASNLSCEVRKTLYDFKINGNQEGCLLFKDLPVESSKFWLTTYGSLLGDPCAAPSKLDSGISNRSVIRFLPKLGEKYGKTYNVYSKF